MKKDSWHNWVKDRRQHWLRKYKLHNGCEQCGYREHFIALDFAHKNNLDKDPATWSGSRSGGMSKLVRTIFRDKRKNTEARKKLIDEVRKCKILCKNCHQVETFNNRELENTWVIYHARMAKLKNEKIQTLEEFFK